MAAAPTATFNFNANDASGISCACSNASNATIASYMRNILIAAGFVNPTVTVTGAIGQLGVPSGNNSGSYTADGHTVGTNSTHPLTLANTEHATPTSGVSTFDTNAGISGTDGLSAANDGYIKNCTVTDNGACSPNTTSNDIFINFGNLVDASGRTYEIASLSFDFQIFADGSCTDDVSSRCGGSGLPNLPDLTLYTTDNGTGVGNVQLGTWDAIAPNSTYSSSYNGSAVTGSNPETAPQRLDVSGPISLANSVHTTSLDFMDWPATIGIDNLYVAFRQTPEPGTLALFAFGLLGLVRIARRRSARPVRA